MSLSSLSSPSLTATPLQADGERREEDAKASGGAEGFFGTLIDIVNPLQHIPVISTLYREATGDTLSSIANIVGGGLFGGPLGIAASMANEVVSAETGTDIGGNVMQQVEAMAAPSAADPYADSAPVSTALTPDQGQSAWLIAMTGSQQTSAEAPDLTIENTAQVKDTLHSLERYRDPTLGLKEETKQQQLRMKLDKIAIDMKA